MADQRRPQTRSGGISERYVGPGARWAMFLRDHPSAPEPTYRLVSPDEVDVPREFLDAKTATDRVVLCTLRRHLGDTEPVRDWKEIPLRETRRDGREVDFVRNIENWRKLRSMALGRALEAAGYPKDTDALQLVILWRRRMDELDAARNGRAIGALPPAEDLERAVVDAARATEHDDAIDVPSDEAEPAPPAVPPEHVVWHVDVLDDVAKLGDEALAVLVEECREKGCDPADPGRKTAWLRARIAYHLGGAAQKVAVAAPAPAETHTCAACGVTIDEAVDGGIRWVGDQPYHPDGCAEEAGAGSHPAAASTG